ncbi:transposase [Streptomyces umbrinus]|uniref:Transposase n=1 Tax=Streptomyces umbrinus TaxID=67370 RepID=A0ABU0T7U7_9ACTN|nr:transposase [Streptomyces umbrinus]
MVRQAEGRNAEPSACALDAQSVKTSANVPASGQGIDAGKKIAGRKRHLGVDTPSRLLAVRVTAASVSDNIGGIHLLSRIATSNPQVRKAWTDTGYRTKAIGHGARLGIDVEAVRRDPFAKGFKVTPRRWVVERTFGLLMHHRRLVRGYETHPHRPEAMIRIAMIDLINRRLTREPTLNWRNARLGTKQQNTLHRSERSLRPASHDVMTCTTGNDSRDQPLLLPLPLG